MSFLAELRQVESPSRAPSRVAVRTPAPELFEAALAASRPALPSPTRHPWAKSFACAALTYVAATAALLAFVAPNLSPGTMAAGSIGSALCVFIVASVLPAFITGMIVRQSPSVWRLSRIAGAYLPLFALVAGLQLAGAGAGAWWPPAGTVADCAP
jgi:hypothetical protein